MIHGDIGMANDFQGRPLTLRRNGVADRSRHVELDVVNGVGRINCRCDLGRQIERLFRPIQVGQQDIEFIAADAGQKCAIGND